MVVMNDDLIGVGPNGTHEKVNGTSASPTAVVNGDNVALQEPVEPPEEFDAETAEVGDDEQDGPTTDHPDKQTQQRRQNTTAFDKWFVNKAAKTDVTKVKVSRKTDQEDYQTLKDMMLAQQAGKIIIGNERAYQKEMYERAKEQNTIAVLDTGSGKTLIAVMLLKYVLEREIDDRAAGKTRKLAFFLVDKVGLMLQQWSVLTTHLRFKVEPFSGDMNIDLWTEKTWQEIYNTNDVIVCTADVLLHCLMRSFVQMEKINLLIFDEAHHAKKNHAYAKICTEFYKKNPDHAERPRIFGMTASPIDIQDTTDINEQARDLEHLLQSRIATTTDAKIREHVHRPVEEIAEYNPSMPRFETRLFQALKAKYWDLHHFKPLFNGAKTINTELGPWCSDMFWSFAFSDKEAKKAEGRVERDWKKVKPLTDEDSRRKVDAEIAQLNQAHQEIKDYTFSVPQLSLDDLSSKVIQLHKYLALQFERPTQTLCLVFVTERATAKLLTSVFSHLGGPYLKAGALLGSGSSTFEGGKSSSREQAMIMHKFKKGELNCLFATSVAEEGLDVPSCNLVVRFDLCKTMIQYIQSRGRARHKNSKFVHLLEVDNPAHEDHLAYLQDSEAAMRKFCNSLPEDRLLLGDQDLNDLAHNEPEEFPIFVIPFMGARLTYHYSLLVLHNFVDSIPRDDDENMSPEYTIYVRNGKFRCEITLPDRTRLPPIEGKSYRRKQWAKMSAAFKACKWLWEEGMLDDNLLSTHKKQQHVMREARLAVTSKKHTQYPVQKKPSLWAERRGTIPETLYLTVLSLPDGWDRPVRTLGLLTRSRLPDFPSFPMFRRDGERSNLHPASIEKDLAVTEAQVSQLTWFMLTIWKDLYNKTYEENDAQMSYWLAPLKEGIVVESCAEVQDPIDWKLLSSIYRQSPLKWNAAMDPTTLINRFIVDPFSGGRRLFTLNQSLTLSMHDPVPPEVATGPKETTTIIQYSWRQWRGSKLRRKDPFIEGQPVFEADEIFHRLNVLPEPNEAEKNAVTHCFICLEPLDISQLPAEVAAMGYLYPAIIHRLESYLIALELAKEVHIDITPARALEAVTKDSDNSDDHDQEKINFQRGMGPNYERLEFIGDCFLKMATTMSSFIHNHGKDEAWMHVERMVLLCNANLFNNAKQRGFPKYIRSMAFSRRTWYPEALNLLQGKGAPKKKEEEAKAADKKNEEGEDAEKQEQDDTLTKKEEESKDGEKGEDEGTDVEIKEGDGRDSSKKKAESKSVAKSVARKKKKRQEEVVATQGLGDKTIADVCEALIGAALVCNVSSGYNPTHHFDNAVRAVTEFVWSAKNPSHNMHTWSDYHASYSMPSYQLAESSASDIHFAAQLQDSHAYVFHYPKLLQSAFAHSSIPRVWAKVPNYQRLEFLGDSVLDMTAVTYLFDKYPRRDPQWLTEHKMAMVSNKFLGALGASLNFNKFLNHSHSEIEGQLTLYVREFHEARTESNGAVDFWTTLRDPPKCLADVVESYVGAVFVDSQFNYAEIQRFFDTHIRPFFEDMSVYDTFANNHPLNKLRELLTTGLGCSHYDVLSRELESPDEYSAVVLAVVVVHGRAVGEGAVAKTGRVAKVRAAEAAVGELGGLAPYGFRETWGCDCVGVGVGGHGGGVESGERDGVAERYEPTAV